MTKDMVPPKKVYDLTEVEFLDWITMQSQSERPLFSEADIKRLGEMAGSSPKLEADAPSKGSVSGYRLMPHGNIKELLDGVWAARDKAFAALKEAA